MVVRIRHGPAPEPIGFRAYACPDTMPMDSCGTPRTEGERVQSTAGRGQQLAAVLGLVSVLGVGAWLRLYRVDRPVFTPDEAFTWRVASCSWTDMLGRAAGDTHPPGHFVLQKIWMGVFGDGVVAVRLLSICCGLTSAMLVYILVLEVITEGKPASSAVQFGAMVGALLAAVHLGQIGASRTARMYSWGILLSGVSSYLLLRALRAKKGAAIWWLVYGLATAAFCYSHSFALFGLAAQAIFVGLQCLRSCRGEGSEQEEKLQVAEAQGQRAPLQGLRAVSPHPGVGFLLSGAFALALFAPWVPTFLRQAARVKESFWIPPVTWLRVQEVFVGWFTGRIDSDIGGPTLWFVVLVVLCVYITWDLNRAGLLFLLQAFVPWALALGVSTWGGRPLLLVRYLLFAQYALIVVLGVTCARLRSRVERLAFAVLVLLPCAWASCPFILRTPNQPPVLAEAVEYLASYHQAEDLIVVDVPAAVNCVGFYAKQAGLNDVKIRWECGSYSLTSHINHIASLTADDVLDWKEGLPPPDLDRYWILVDRRGDPGDGMVHEGWQVTLSHEITYGRYDRKTYSLRLVERKL